MNGAFVSPLGSRLTEISSAREEDLGFDRPLLGEALSQKTRSPFPVVGDAAKD